MFTWYRDPGVSDLQRIGVQRDAHSREVSDAQIIEIKRKQYIDSRG